MGLLSGTSVYTERFGNVGLALGGLWILALIVYSFGALGDSVDYAASVDPRLAWGAPAALAIAILGSIAYARLRRGEIRRYELVAIAGFAAAACFLREPLGAAVAVAVFTAAFALGRAVLARLGFERVWEAASSDPGTQGMLSRVPMSPTALRATPPLGFSGPIEELAYGCGVGFGLMTTVLFAVGLGGQLKPPLLAVLLILPLAAFRGRVRSLYECFRQLHRSWKHCEELRDPLVGLAVPFAALFVLFGLSVALAPSIGVDAMRHHLADVVRFLNDGGLAYAEPDRYAYHPKDAELLLTLASALGGEPAARLLNPGFFALALLAAFAIARRCGARRRDAVLGVFVVATIPFLHWTGVVVKNDLQVAFLQLASLLAYFRARESEDRRILALGVFLLAMSFGIKHTTVFGAVPIGLLYLWSARREPRLLLGLGLLALVFGAHWHALTLARTGNPVYPWGAADIKQWAPLEGLETMGLPFQTAGRPALWITYALYPWTTHFQGRATFEAPTNNPTGLFLLLFAPVWLVTRGQRRSREPLCLFVCLVCYVLWGYIWGILRYAIPMIILLAILMASRLGSYIDRQGGIAKPAARFALVYGFAFTILPTLFIEVNFPKLEYFAGRLSRDQYLSSAVKFLPAIEHLHRFGARSDLVLTIAAPGASFAPDPNRLHSLTSNARMQHWIGVRTSKYRYSRVIGPQSRQEEILGLFSPGEIEYEDEHYFVAKLP